jgi:formylglycine-generating enzyme required for sulfatase activity
MSVAPDKVKTTFLSAVEIPAGSARTAFVSEACEGDEALKQRVVVLLDAHEGTDRLLDHSAVEHVTADPDFVSEDNRMGLRLADGDALNFLGPAERPDSLGRLGHYDVLDVIGRGGMGLVLRAFDSKLHRVVAIKVLTAQALLGSGAPRTRFAREARAAAVVTHENIVGIHAVEETAPVPFLVMQYVDGPTLEHRLDETGPMAVKEIVRIGLQIAQGLAAAHAHGVIHRDIKPANILLERGAQDRVKITDFGLARAVDDVSLTQSGYIAGTPMFMSPEQARGERVDHRTDLFSLGSVLYALCTGHAPFHANSSLSVLKRVCEDTPRPIREANPDLPRWLEPIIDRLLAKDVAHRYQSASDVAAQLSLCLTSLQAGVTPPLMNAALASSEVARRRSRMRRVFGGAGVLFVALVAGFFAFRDRAENGISAPFDIAEAEREQRKWAEQLGRPIIETNSIGLQLAIVPPGTYLMGSTEEDIEKQKAIKPDMWWNRFFYHEMKRHKVTLTRPFLLGTTEVTVGQYKHFTDVTGYKSTPETDGAGGLVDGKSDVQWNWRNPGHEQTDRHPVVQLTWDDAAAFCRWLSEKEGRTYRLPTEAEWEWACRAGSHGDYCFGSDAALLPQYANAYDDDKDRIIIPTAQKRANAWGLYDMHGNVFEWCADMFEPSFSSAPVVDPTGPTSGQDRVQRSGYRYAQLIRSAFRLGTGPKLRENFLGFRVACSIPAAP